MHFEYGLDYLGCTPIIETVLTFLLDKHSSNGYNGCGAIVINKIFLYFSI